METKVTMVKNGNNGKMVKTVTTVKVVTGGNGKIAMALWQWKCDNAVKWQIGRTSGHGKGVKWRKW